MELNKIYCIDVLDGLKQLEDNSIDIIITSPPYNKMGLNKMKTTWNNSKWYMTINYNGDNQVDNMNEEEYENWQIEILKECYRVLKDNGSMFYNHKNRIPHGTGNISNPYEWLMKSPFKIRQEIIWDRGSSLTVNTCRYLPSSEKIFWLTKTNKPNFYRSKETKMKGEVWRCPFEKNNPHPAPYPIELVDNILDCIPNDPNNPITVLDPFNGSATTSISAIKHNMNWIGFDKFQCYVDMGNERIKKFLESNNNE